ncbi:hypothetical protein BDA96_06G104500 [Sorghum bicolor]|uniref:Uncharacterized protein n=1 Tax=Sorghum bicolor TaxID=4558 RepID=A0A921UC04_SORBI|nr:hypothetical protein BDA96_06G104500 [Sorghum bicolor]
MQNEFQLLAASLRLHRSLQSFSNFVIPCLNLYSMPCSLYLENGLWYMQVSFYFGTCYIKFATFGREK